MNQRKEKSKQKACSISLRKFQFAQRNQVRSKNSQVFQQRVASEETTKERFSKRALFRLVKPSQQQIIPVRQQRGATKKQRRPDLLSDICSLSKTKSVAKSSQFTSSEEQQRMFAQRTIPCVAKFWRLLEGGWTTQNLMEKKGSSLSKLCFA